MYQIDYVNINDIESIYELECEAFDKYERYSLQQLQEIVSNKSYKFLKLYETESIFSYIIVLDLIDNYEILKICTNKKYENKGFATLLIQFVIENSTQNKIKIYLEVRKSNIKAQKFYSSNKFIISGIRKNYYSNTEDAILMERML